MTIEMENSAVLCSINEHTRDLTDRHICPPHLSFHQGQLKRVESLLVLNGIWNLFNQETSRLGESVARCVAESRASTSGRAKLPHMRA